MDTKRLGRRIRGFRKLKGYTQVEFAKVLDISMAVMGKVERGTEQASDALLDDIAARLSITKEELTLRSNDNRQ